MKFLPYEELVDLKTYLCFSTLLSAGGLRPLSIVEFFTYQGIRHLRISRFDKPTPFTTELTGAHIASYGRDWLCRRLV